MQNLTVIENEKFGQVVIFLYYKINKVIDTCTTL